MWDDFFPYTHEDLVAFFSEGAEAIVLQRIRLERDRQALYTADAFWYHRQQNRRLVLQLITINLEQNNGSTMILEMPSAVQGLESALAPLLLPKLEEIFLQLEKQPQLAQQPILVASFPVPDDVPSLDGPGENRVAPGYAWNELYVHSSRRYLFAAQRITGLTVLDLGCGVGYGSKLLARTARQVIAVDVDLYPLQYGRETYPDPRIERLQIPAIHTDSKLPFEDDTFDAIVNFEVIEHVPVQDMETYFAEIARVLKPNGFIIMSTPNKHVYIHYPDPFHVSLMTVGEFRSLLQSRFRQVEMVGQVRSQGLPHTSREFAIVAQASDENEIFIAVCQQYWGAERPIVLPPPTVWATPEVAIDNAQESDRPRISVIVHTRNEEGNLAACLESVKDLAEEIIVMDMESTDKTVEIARRYTDKVYSHPFIRDFDAFRNVSVEYATHDWVFYLDADERVPQSLRMKLPGFIQQLGEDVSAVQLPYKNYFLGYWIQHAGGWYPGYRTPMLLKRGKFVWGPRVHEGVKVDGRAVHFPADDPQVAIEHYTAPTIGHWLEKLTRYSESESEAGKLENAGAPCTWQGMAQKFAWGFRYYYDDTAGKMDGPVGFVLSILAGINELVNELRYAENLLAQGGNGEGLAPPSAADFLRLATAVASGHQEPAESPMKPVLPPIPSWWAKFWQRLQRGGPGRLLCIDGGDFASWNLIARDGWQICCPIDILTAKAGTCEQPIHMEVLPKDCTLSGEIDSVVVLGPEIPSAVSALKSGGAFLIGTPAFPPDVEEWRAELEHRFDASVHLVDPEADTPWLLAFGWKGTRTDPAQRSILMVTHQRALQMFGGGETQLLETLFGLNRGGIRADISLSLRLDANRYDLIHLFSVYHGEKLGQIANIRKPIAISPIYWDYTELRFAAVVIQAIFDQVDEASIPKTLDGWRKGELQISGFSKEQARESGEVWQLQRSVLASAHIMLPNSDREVEVFRNSFGDLDNEIRIVPNAVRPETFLEAKPESFVEQFGLTDFVLCSGRIEPNKNQLMLIWALRDTGIPLVLAGRETDPRYAALCHKWARPNVHFVGELSRDLLASAYAAARVHALPSWSETPGLVNLEAGLAGCNLVVGNRGSEREYLGEFAFVSDPGDADSILEAVMLAWKGGPARLEAQRQHILQKYTWARTVDATRAAYEEILHRKKERIVATEPHPLAIVWEGSQFVHHSLALVNREICMQLVESNQDLSIIPYEADQFGPEQEERFGKIVERIYAPLFQDVDVHVRHQWPPNFTPPAAGHWVMIQPWEFGSLPRQWIEPMRSQVDEIWVPSSFVRNCYIQSGIPGHMVHIIPNGINSVQFHPTATRVDLPPFHGVGKRYRFLFVGGTIPRKGIDLLLSVYVNEFTENDDVCLVIKDLGTNTFYNGQTLGEQIRQMQEVPGSPPILYLNGEMLPEQMPGLYTACDCLVHPYRGEGFGLPIIEAMACGLPTIVTNYGPVLDFCDTETSYLIPAGVGYFPQRRIDDWETVNFPWFAEPNRDALAQTMRFVYEHPEEAKAKGTKASERMMAGFTWAQAAEKAVARMRVLRGMPIRREQR